MFGLIIITCGAFGAAAGITISALIEDFSLVREWRLDHGR